MTGDEGARDPYFLYAASNLGSFAALMAYPLLVEPTLRLKQQASLWTAGYVALLLLTAVCAATVWHSKPVVDEGARTVEPGEALSWGRRARWVALAFVPSSLLLAVTSYISTDVASVPLLWVVPLSLYLLTFVLAFSPSAGKVRALAHRLMPLALLVLVLVLVAQMSDPMSFVIPVHLIMFSIVALFCHGELAQDRPSPARLTEFYFWIALGGMLGGLFNALVARYSSSASPSIRWSCSSRRCCGAATRARRWRQRPEAGLDRSPSSRSSRCLRSDRCW